MNIFLVIILSACSLFILLMIFYFWGKKVIPLKNISFDDLHLYLGILFFRGNIEKVKLPDGRLYIKEPGSKKVLILKKYKDMGNHFGIYFYIPFSNNSEKNDCYHILNEKNLEFWEEHLLEIDSDVIGIDIGMDFQLGVELIELLSTIIFSKNVDEILLNLFFESIDMDVINFPDHHKNIVDQSKFNGDLLMPLHYGTRLTVGLGFGIKKIVGLFFGTTTKN